MRLLHLAILTAIPLVALVKDAGLQQSLIIIYPSLLDQTQVITHLKACSYALSFHLENWRSPGAYSEFLSKFLEFLSSLVLKSDNVIITGDFDNHVNVANDSLTTAFNSLLETIGFCQCVHEPLCHPHSCVSIWG